MHLIKDPKCLECTFNEHFHSETTSAMFSAASLGFDHTPFISIQIGCYILSKDLKLQL